MIAWAQYPYDGTTVLLTGGGSGIGRSIARAYLEQGASVLVTGRHAETLQETVAGFPLDRAAVLATDMATEDGVGGRRRGDGTAVGSVGHRRGQRGHIHTGHDRVPGRRAVGRAMREINLDGLIRLARLSVPALRASRGTFLAISSVAGFGGDWNQAGYNATKGAVNALIQSMALDLGRDGVRVNAIAPAFTATRLTQERLDDPVFWAALRDRIGVGPGGRTGRHRPGRRCS